MAFGSKPLDTSEPTKPIDAKPKQEELKVSPEVEKQYPMPQFKPLLEIVDNWNNVPDRAFPEAITVNVPVDYKLERDGQVIGSSPAPAGTQAVPLKHKPGQLLITDRPQSSMRAVVNVDDTDFKERIQTFYDSRVAEARDRVMTARKVAMELESMPKSEGDPQVLAGGWHDPNDPRFNPVKEYLKAGKFSTAYLEEAKKWRWVGADTHEGEKYDAVLVYFETETIFGIFPHTVKCLLQNGRVVKWVDPVTGDLRS